jgi:predicted small metal-binding protein
MDGSIGRPASSALIFYARSYNTSSITMAEGKQFICACGWTVASPLGEDDVLEHAEIHAKEYHPELNLGREDLRSNIRTVNIPEPRPM